MTSKLSASIPLVAKFVPKVSDPAHVTRKRGLREVWNRTGTVPGGLGKRKSNGYTGGEGGACDWGFETN